MISIYRKELSTFFTTIIGPLIIGLFLIINGMLLWSDISEINILDNPYSSMDTFFTISPLILLIFIPALGMRSISEEYNSGTIEPLMTKPITTFQIVYTKFLAILTLILISIAPTLLYVLTIYYLGETPGNLDLAGIFGSYIGLICLSSVFASISVFASTLSQNQIISFVLGIVISIIFYLGFDLLSKISILESVNTVLQKIGILYHYETMSKGLLMLSDLMYFISLSVIFIKCSEIVVLKQKE